MLDKTILAETMALQTGYKQKKKGKLKFLYRKNSYLTKDLHKIPCNDLIQLHFDYVYPAWYPNLNEKIKKKTQIIRD